MITNRMVTFAVLGGGVLSLLFSFVSGQIIFTVISSFFFAISMLLWKYGYILIPFFTSAANVIEVRGGYNIPPTRDCITKRAGGGYYASKFLEIQFYESMIDKDDAGKSSMIESFEKSLASLKNVLKISLLVSAVDLTKHIDKIKAKRSSAESRRRRLPPNSEEIVRLDREIAMWNRQLERITRGDRSLEITAFAQTTAFGVTREEAISKARRQAKEAKTILSSTLGADVAELLDTDMIKCFEWSYFIPADSEQLRDEVF
ncbi:hypothetical protein JW721_05310 [Candidatus Micrarchaeota archaeon]|nr:hypothetical protein [Candidatus Micrarchaeota archaeon]